MKLCTNNKTIDEYKIIYFWVFLYLNFQGSSQSIWHEQIASFTWHDATNKSEKSTFQS